jgi:lipoprotein-releasing system permease protein
MFYHFSKYFFSYIFFSKTRQRLLFLSIIGLVLSSFSLLVLQSTMGGLQRNLTLRSKKVLGDAEISLNPYSPELYERVKKFLQQRKIQFSGEYYLEALLSFETFLSPIILHGIEGAPPGFLEGSSFHDLIMPYDLAARLKIYPNSLVKIISPAHVDPLMGDLPRYATIAVGSLVETRVPEVDSVHVWTRASFVQNLIGKRELNLIRLYSPMDFSLLKKDLAYTFSSLVTLSTWEEKNEALVFSLDLETKVMVFLFVAMSAMVSLCITAGLMIFFDKIKLDLGSFWILGAPKSRLYKSYALFLQFLGISSSLLGVVFGLVFLWLFDKFGGNIMPDVFVERKIPIFLTLKGIFVSFFVPYLISTIFSTFSLLQFKKEQNFLDHVRAVG